MSGYDEYPDSPAKRRLLADNDARVRAATHRWRPDPFRLKETPMPDPVPTTVRVALHTDLARATSDLNTALALRNPRASRIAVIALFAVARRAEALVKGMEGAGASPPPDDGSDDYTGEDDLTEAAIENRWAGTDDPDA